MENVTNATDIQEAILAGESVLRRGASLKESLKKARRWGDLDLLGIGGFISEFGQWSELDLVKTRTTAFENAVDRFNAALPDQEDIKLEDQLNLTRSDQIKDILLGGALYSHFDFSTQNKVKWAYQEVDNTMNLVEDIIESLRQ